MSSKNHKPGDRRAPMAMSGEEFRAVGHRLVDQIAELLDALPSGPVTRAPAPHEVRAHLPGGGLPEDGEPAARLLEEAVPLLRDLSLFNGHPRFFGYITSSAAPIGALADMLAAVINANVGSWQLAPAAAEIERQCIRWIADLLGTPDHHAGILVSGGNLANFVAFLAARRAKARADTRSRGLAAHPGELRIYASTETHTWIHKAADLFGHGTAAIRWIEVDRDQRIHVDALRARIRDDARAGHRPFLLVGNAGTVSTGAVDPLADMAAVAREHDLWFHVDGAYGALAATVPGAPAELAGLGLADSVAVDPHKWLYVPLEAGCTLVRDQHALKDAFSYSPPYYHFAGDDGEPRTNFYELGLQNSRGFRALKVWLALRQAGASGYRSTIAEDMALARELHRLVDAEPELDVCTHSLSITTFRYVPPDLQPGSPEVDGYLDQLNEDVLVRLQRSGEVFLSNAIVRGAFVLRACIVNFRTTRADIEALPGLVLRCARQADRALRPAALHAAD